ncbi:Proteasome subunit alpha type-1 [Acipenser ruthenus]|uniref:Proteasome subunit alpha type n=1 Tax=Acipenser ruthenus TaxID=7906 RepID=A0A444TW89_ACIRT|nr:Proteasome subunit alpha type-1 [Acipenser ruthenus]
MASSDSFRNQYDNDVTVWSPQGRIHQIEYAMEAVKQGSATVGLKSRTHAVLVALKDMGPHIFQTCPSANYFDCKAMSIGARSQSARTYLERHMDGFLDCNLNELVRHGLHALRETLPAEQDLTTKNVSIGVIAKDMEFTIYDDDDVAPFLEGLEERPQRKVAPPTEEPAAEKAEEPMEH